MKHNKNIHRNNKKTKNPAKMEMDYQEPDWPNKCSLRKKGPTNQTDVPGCGARIELNCDGGCLRIIKVLYSCKMQDQSIPAQLSKVKGKCEGKESCSITPSRDLFGYSQCPDSPDDDMVMWISYRCDGGVVNARPAGRRDCWETNGKSPGYPFF